MAQVTITKILDGTRSAVFHVYLVSDGISGDLTDEVLIDPTTDFDPELTSVPTLTIEQIWYDLTGFDARLEFDYLASDTGVWAMSGGQASHVDFCHFGGLKDRSNELDGTGKLKLTTRGFASTDDAGTIVIKVRKD